MPISSVEAQELFAVIQQKVTDAIFDELEKHISDRPMPDAKPFMSATDVKTWDSGKIKWEPKIGAKGPFEQSNDYNNVEFKNILKLLGDGGGRIRRKEADGTWFYWVFQRGDAVGRKKVE